VGVVDEVARDCQRESLRREDARRRRRPLHTHALECNRAEKWELN
jgi:hypothetical protein